MSRNSEKKNPELELAFDFLQYTHCNIFLTGRAGTGKTTFLRSIGDRISKQFIVTAPTGVAALNAGGVTLHSFFQLPLTPYIPDGTYGQDRQRRFRFSKEKKRIIREIDLLIIDEISMVRADLMDAIDATLRLHRRNQQPFGGVQVLMIGDLHQLSPVVTDRDRDLIAQYYETPYFFSSRVMQQSEPVTIELRHIYRQSDRKFIEILNSIRNNTLDQSAAALLNQRHIPDFSPEEQGYITLTTHNRRADAINQARMESLSGPCFTFNAEITGDFPAQLYPVPPVLKLRKGAQVMFTRNDPSDKGQYYNGKIGTVSDINQDRIVIVCQDDSTEIVAQRVEWKNIQYGLDEETGQIREEVKGSFVQYPLRLAWAITIHKSQGLTFDRAVIDTQAAFAAGQVYVALSRCRSMEGLVLSSSIPTHMLAVDRAVAEFEARMQQNAPSSAMLAEFRRQYEQRLLLECFDFAGPGNLLGHLGRLVERHKNVLRITGADIPLLVNTARSEIFRVGSGFSAELKRLFESADSLPSEHDHIKERLNRASRWFQDRFKEVFGSFPDDITIETDNKEIKKQVQRLIDHIREEISIKLAGIRACSDFSPESYQRAMAEARRELQALDSQGKKKKKDKVNRHFIEDDITHPDLFSELRAWRKRTAERLGVAPFQVMHQRVLIQIAVRLPVTSDELLSIPGIGKKTLEKYGEEIIEIVTGYRDKHGIREVTLPEPSSPELQQVSGSKDTGPEDRGHKHRGSGRPGTKEITYEMIRQGLSIEEVAKKRGLAPSTIQGHLCFHIRQGRLDINDFIAPERQKAIAEVIEKDSPAPLGEIKALLGEHFSYGEIKMMMAHMEHIRESSGQQA